MKTKFRYLKIGHTVLKPVSIKKKVVKYNYLLSLISILWGVFSYFDLDLKLTAQNATTLMQIALFVFPLLYNLVIIATSKYLSLHPLVVIEEEVDDELEEDTDDTKED
jgi:hypothetical protein